MRGLLLPDISVGYVSIPKTVCTSIKYSFYSILSGEDYTYDTQKHPERTIHWYFKDREKLIDGANDRVIVIRDPVERFLSAYANRVTHHWELSEGFLSKIYAKRRLRNLIFNPGIGQFIDYLDHYTQFSSIEWHTRPVGEFIDYDLDFFNHIIPIKDITHFEALLSTKMAMPVKFPRYQSGGKKYSVKELDSSQLEFIFDYYKRDYDMLKDFYTPEMVFKKWRGR